MSSAAGDPFCFHVLLRLGRYLVFPFSFCFIHILFLLQAFFIGLDPGSIHLFYPVYVPVPLPLHLSALVWSVQNAKSEQKKRIKCLHLYHNVHALSGLLFGGLMCSELRRVAYVVHVHRLAEVRGKLSGR